MTIVLLLVGCRDPLLEPPLSKWKGCLSDGWATVLVPDPSRGFLLRSTPDETKTQLSLDARWDIAPFFTGVTTAELLIDLPRPVVVGYRSELDALDGVYTEGQGFGRFRSRHLQGTVEVLAIDQGKAEVRLDVRATRPESGDSEPRVAGVVQLPITTEDRCPE